MKELWKDIKGYKGLYQVSNLGRVRSLDRSVIDKKGRVLTFQGRLLRPAKSKKGGYLRVILSKDGQSKTCKVHRLVAQAFIPNPYGLPCVNHKDEITTNNCVNNLEWCTWAYNDNYGSHGKKIADDHSKQVAQFTLDGKLVAVYKNAYYASSAVNVGDSQIRACAIGKARQGPHGKQTFKTAGGYKWKYVEDLKKEGQWNEIKKD